MQIKYKFKDQIIGSNIVRRNADKITIKDGWIHIEKDENSISTKMEFIYDIEIKK